MKYVQNTEESTLIVERNGIKLFFNTETARQKFIDTIDDEIEKVKTSLQNVYKNYFTFDVEVFAIIRYYKTCNKRGFYVEYMGEKYRWLNEVEFKIDVKKK